MERRLAAILAADVVGYSRLIRADEEQTILDLRELRSTLIDPAISDNHGRIVKLMGDGILVEFTSAVDAVACAERVQTAMIERNEQAQPERQMVFRIGINLGDVVIDGDDIQGDGVNVATRLEAASDAGGICISSAIHDQVRDRLNLTFTDMGEQQIKNVDRPIQMWKWTSAAAAQTTGASDDQPALPLPDKPSIAVLPFDNMSADPEQEYFADGMAEDIITALSRYHDLFVIARNSSFTYRGTAVDIRQVGRELGVRYVLEGSVRRAGGKVRITAQLIEAETGNHLWAERYDRSLDDVFEVQDEITLKVSGVVGSEILVAEADRVARRTASDLPVWEMTTRAEWHNARVSKEDTIKSRELCLKSIEKYGDNSRAYSAMAMGYCWDILYGWSDDPPAVALKSALSCSKTAIELDPKNEGAFVTQAMALWFAGQFEAANRAAETAVELNPNYGIGHAVLGYVLGYAALENHERAFAEIDMAIRLAPRDLHGHWAYVQKGMLHLMAGHFDKAVENARAALRRLPTLGTAHRVAAASLAMNGQIDEAHAAWKDAMDAQPMPNLEAYFQTVVGLFGRPEEAHNFIHGMRVASGECSA